eukprot:jgi/Botrbrau1/16170/Bobra.0272s0005.2
MLPGSQGGGLKRKKSAWELQMETKARRVCWELGKGGRPKCAWTFVIITIVVLGGIALVQLGKFRQFRGIADKESLVNDGLKGRKEEAAIGLVLDSFRRVTRLHAEQLKQLNSELDFLNNLSGLCDTALANKSPPPSLRQSFKKEADGEGDDKLCRARAPSPISKQTSRRHTHRMALVIPFRDRQKHLDDLLPQIADYLQAQGRDFDILIMEQSPGLRFNRGALLNAAALLLQGSEHDYFVFHDVDTYPTKAGNIQYDFPTGPAPYHITPTGIHPDSKSEDFFGGVTAFTREQLEDCNGYSALFWGWGGEDDNMRERLKLVGRWPPERPDVPQDHSLYFVHASHARPSQVRVRTGGNGTQEYLEEEADVPSTGTSALSAQVADDFVSGLNSTAFYIKAVKPYKEYAVKYTIDLYCDMSLTPWCSGSEPMPLLEENMTVEYEHD